MVYMMPSNTKLVDTILKDLAGSKTLFRRRTLVSILKLVLEVFLMWKHLCKQGKKFEFIDSNMFFLGS